MAPGSEDRWPFYAAIPDSIAAALDFTHVSGKTEADVLERIKEVAGLMEVTEVEVARFIVVEAERYHHRRGGRVNSAGLNLSIQAYAEVKRTSGASTRTHKVALVEDDNGEMVPDKSQAVVYTYRDGIPFTKERWDALKDIVASLEAMSTKVYEVMKGDSMLELLDSGRPLLTEGLK